MTFSPWVKVYGESGFWLKVCRMARHDTCRGLVWFKDKKGCPTLFPWHKCKNDDLETLCKTGHACTYADTQVSNFYGHVMLGLRIHFLYFKSTQCFQNMFFYQFVHSSESISGVWENLHSIHPSGVYTFFLKTSYDQWIFPKKSWKSSLFKSMLVFQPDNLFFFFLLLFFLSL